MFSDYRKTDAANDSIVKINISIKQLKMLEDIVGSELGDAEQGISPYDEKTLQGLLDQFWKHLYVRMSEAEINERNATQKKRNLAASEAYEVSLKNSRSDQVAA